jgi:hypothetical protein
MHEAKDMSGLSEYLYDSRKENTKKPWKPLMKRTKKKLSWFPN